MKKILLLLVTSCFCLNGWAQLIEYNDMGNTFEFGSGQDPEFVEFNGNLYFISDFNGDNKEYIMSIDGNNDFTMVYDPSSGVGSDQWDIQALTVFDNQLYFALANLTTNPGNYFLYRLNGGIGEIVSGSARVSDPYESRLIAYNNVLYFAGRENGSVPEIGLISYSPIEGISQVNTTVPGEDFLPSRFVVGANNTLYFFRQTQESPFITFGLYALDTSSGSNNLSTIPPDIGSWGGDGFSAPVISIFGDNLIIISKITINGIEEIRQVSSTNVVSAIPGLPSGSGVSRFSFKNPVNYNNGGIIYNNKLALFRASNSTLTTTDFVDDKLVLLSEDGTVVEYDLEGLDGGLDGAGFYGTENGALIFYATGSSGEKIYELRETTNNVLPDVRPILPFSTQDISPLFGKVFNSRLYYYGNPLNASDGSQRTLNYYDTSILNFSPVIETQEQVDFFGSLGFVIINEAALFIQDQSNVGLSINNLSALSSLQSVEQVNIAFTGIQNLDGLENLEVVFSFFEIQDNDELISLDGLNTDIIFDTQVPNIYNNDILVGFCALQQWALANPGLEAAWNNADIFGNGYNPTWTQLQNPTQCEPTAGISTADAKGNVNIFPNPVSTILYIDSKVNGDFEMFDLNGRKVRQGVILSGRNKIDTTVLQNGLYILNISNESGILVNRIMKN